MVDDDEDAARTTKFVGVVFHNDDMTPMDLVVFALQAIFDMPEAEAKATMLRGHHQGQVVVGSYPLDVARAKVSAVTKLAQAEGHPLRCTIAEL